MRYEEVLTAVGGCGLYHVLILSFSYLTITLNGIQFGTTVFLVPEIKHRCAIPGLPNDTYAVKNEVHAELIKEYIPKEMVDGKSVYNKCHFYTNKSVLGNQSLSKCSSWVYDKSIFETTITSDFNFVCGEEWHLSEMYTLYFAGYVISMFAFGWLSDRFGRKKVIIGSVFLEGLSAIISSQITNYSVILFLRFLTAVGDGGCVFPAAVLGIEITSVKKRTRASIILHLFYTFGLFAAVGFAYVIRNWRSIMLYASAGSIPYGLLCICLLPESPRWLLVRNKKKEGERILNKIARVNKRNFKCNSEDIEISVIEDRTVRLWKIFTIQKLRKRTLLMMFNWFLVCFGYYGLIVNTGNLSGDIFLNLFLNAVVEIPAIFMCLVLLNRVGRKKMYSGSILIGGISGILTIFPVMYASDDLQWTTTALAILSKLCVTVNFVILFLHSSEIYPTCIRNGAVGFVSTFGRFGSIIFPYVMTLKTFVPGKLGESLPLLVMGIGNILAAISYLFLPETNNKPMQDTFDDISKQIYKNSSKNAECQFDVDLALNQST